MSDVYEPKYKEDDFHWYVFNCKTNEFTTIKHLREEVIERYCEEMNDN